MPIDVIFRGPILFLKRDALSEQALIPDGERELIDDFGHRGNHPDGDISRPHFAGIAIFEGEKQAEAVFRADLRQKVVRLIADDGEVASRTTDINRLVPIDAAANVGRAPMRLISKQAHNYWSRVAARVEFRGGTLRSNQESRATFIIDGVETLKKPTTIPLSAAWTTDRDAARIQVCNPDGTGLEQIRVKKGQAVFVYNWDERTPTADALRLLPECEDGGQFKTDTDFKWLYELFDPPVGTYTAWLGGGSLPAPQTACVEVTGDQAGRTGVPSPGSSGCVGGTATDTSR